MGGADVRSTCTKAVMGAAEQPGKIALSISGAKGGAGCSVGSQCGCVPQSSGVVWWQRRDGSMRWRCSLRNDQGGRVREGAWAIAVPAINLTTGRPRRRMVHVATCGQNHSGHGAGRRRCGAALCLRGRGGGAKEICDDTAVSTQLCESGTL